MNVPVIRVSTADVLMDLINIRVFVIVAMWDTIVTLVRIVLVEVEVFVVCSNRDFARTNQNTRLDLS